MRYDTSRTGIVIDSNTGLEWQQTVSAKMFSWNEAGAYADSLELQGNKWRIPTINELMSIIDYGEFDPAIDKNIFGNILGMLYWTSSLYQKYSGYFWTVSFIDGTTYFDYLDSRHKVRCVR